MANQFDLLAKLPFDKDRKETVTAISTWEVAGENGIVVATTLGHLFIVRFRGDDVEISRPLQFVTLG